jgi:splicing factor, arginine/serine-rich 1
MKSDPARVYVGNLNSEITEKQLEDTFRPFGIIREISIKVQQGMYYAFVEFQDPNDAQAAIKARNGFNLRGCNIRVELPRAAMPHAPKPAIVKPSVQRLLIHNLPRDVHWQELKDTVKQHASVLFVDVRPDGAGLIELASLRDVDSVVELYHLKTFTSRAGSRAALTITTELGQPISSLGTDSVEDKWFKFPGIQPGVFT